MEPFLPKTVVKLREFLNIEAIDWNTLGNTNLLQSYNFV